jgi:hypothetical protein
VKARGRIDFTGIEPGVILLTDAADKRHVLLSLGERELQVTVKVADVQRLINELQRAQLWAKRGKA